MWFPREMLINENTKILEQGKVYKLQTNYKLQHRLGERGKGGKIKAEGVNCPKNFDPAL